MPRIKINFYFKRLIQSHNHQKATIFYKINRILLIHFPPHKFFPFFWDVHYIFDECLSPFHKRLQEILADVASPSLSVHEQSWSTPWTIIDVLYNVSEGTSHAFSVCVRPYHERSSNPKFYLNDHHLLEEHSSNDQISWSLSSAFIAYKYPLPYASQHHFYCTYSIILLG
jgi:hypothetical protein